MTENMIRPPNDDTEEEVMLSPSARESTNEIVN